MTKSMYSLAEGLLIIEGKQIFTEFVVAQAVQSNERVIVRFVVPFGVVKNDNIVCYDRHGSLLWTIEVSPHGGAEDNPYANLKVDSEGKVLIETYQGVEYDVNILNGKVSPVGFQRI